ncbi:MAG: deoxyribodipyrimidine photo-lyase, partial [Sphingobacteriales bacterium]
MKKSQKINIFWFRRDLRIEDNIGLAKAFADGLPVLPVFIFDKNILDKLQNPTDARVTFIYDTLKKIDNELREKGSGILILHGSPLECWNDILERYNVNEVFYN